MAVYSGPRLPYFFEQIKLMSWALITVLTRNIIIIIIIIIITLFIVDGFQMYKLKCENYNNLQYIYTYIYTYIYIHKPLPSAQLQTA